MSKQTHTKKNTTVILFLILVGSIGFPFSSLQIPTDLEAGSNYAIINFFLGKGMVGLSIFDPLREEVNTIPEVFAQESEYPIVTRDETTETTQVTETRFVAKLGLPAHIQNDGGDWIADLFFEDANGLELESGSISYYFDKTSCSMAIYDSGRINPESPAVFGENKWVTKVAVNGTDSWTDVSQNFLPCTLTSDVGANTITINSTKSDANGTMVEQYIYDRYKGMKESVYFTNNDPTLTNHKFSFSNILMDTPQNINFMSAPDSHLNYTDPFTNSTWKMNYLTMYDLEFQPYSFEGSPVEQIGVGNSTQTITIPRDDFFDIINVNGTDYYEQVFKGVTFIEDLGEFNVRNYVYGFTNEEDFDKLWAIKFVTHPDFTMDTYFDYANVTATLPVGETTMIDPVIDTFTNFQSFSVSIGSISGNCNSASSFGKSPTGFGASIGVSISGSKPVSCGNSVMIFDITGIPDLATPIRGTMQINVTAYGCSSGSIFSICAGGGTSGYFQHSMTWYDCSSEDLTVLPDVLLRQAIYGTGAGTICGITGTGGSQFAVGTWGGFTGIRTQTQTSVLSNFIIDFEEHLESGDVRYNLVHTSGSGNANSPIGAVHVGGSKSGNAGSTWSTLGSFLEVEYDFFDVPSEPTNVICSPFSPTDILIDWDSPLSTGGRPIDFYNIERDSTGTGNAFTPLIQVPIFPTNYIDGTIIQGLGFLYRVAAVNGEGVGAFSNSTGSCGIVGQSGEVNNLSAFNQALGIVALDWTEPLFTGNTEILGYQIDRTTGTPDTDDTWTFVQHFTTVPYAGEVRICHIAEFCGGTQGNDNNGDNDARFDGLWLTTGSINTGKGNVYFFKDFLVEEIINRKIQFSWEQYKRPAGFSFIGSGEWETKAYIADGVFDLSGVNEIGGASEFAQGKAGTEISAGLMHIPDVVGNGLLYDCFDNVAENPSQLLDGGGSDNVDLPFLSQIQGFGIHTLYCVVDDLALAQQPRVTVIFAIRDQQSGLIGCGSNCASSGSGAVNLDYIDIEGVGLWDYYDTLPTETIITFVDPPPNIGETGTVQDQRFVIGDGFITLVEDTGNTNIEYLDNTVVELTNYGYRVFALNSEGISVQSNVAIIFTAGAPDNVATPIATATGTQSINLQWDTPQLNGGTVAFYEIERKTGVGGIFQDLDTTTETSYDDGTGLFALQSAQEYCYKVKVTTNTGSSDGFSPEACATTFDAPSEVLNLQVTALDGSSVNMSFDTPLSDGGSPIIGYKVERKIGGSAFITQDESTLIQFRNDTGLPIGTIITYRVSASNQFGQGDTATDFDTTDPTPQVPQNFACSSATPDSINISWDTPLTFSQPTGYQITRNIDGGGFSVLVADTASTATMYVDEPLLMDTIYGYRILAHTSEGDTLFTDDVSCKVLGNPQFPPEDFQANFPLVIPHEMTLTWDIPNTFGIPIESFVIERDDGAGFNELATLPSNAVGMIDNNLDNDVQQKYRIKITGEVGDTAYSVGIPETTNQISHWHYEKTVADTGDNKNSGTLFGVVNYNNTIHNGLGLTFDGNTRLEVDNESDYDFQIIESFGLTTYYQGNSTGTDQMIVTKASSPTATGYKFFIDTTGVPALKLTATSGTDELHILGSTDITDGQPHFLGFGYTPSAVGTPTFVEDFVSCTTNDCNGTWNYVPDGNRIFVDTTNDEIDFTLQSNIDNDIIYYDLGSNIGSKYELQFKLNFNNINSGASTEYMAFGITDSISPPKTADHDSINYVIQQAVGTNHIGVDFIDNNVIDQSASCDSDNITLSTGVDYFFEIEVDGTAVNGKLYSGNFGDLGGILTNSQSCTISGTIDDLRYLYLSSVSAVQTETMAGSLELVNVYDGLLAGAQGVGVSIMVDGVFETKNFVTDNLSGAILNNEPLVIGADSSGNNELTGILDETRMFGDGTLDDDQMENVYNEEIQTVAPINATMSLVGSTFADISSEEPTIVLISGFPLPIISGNVDLQNFTATTVNSVVGIGTFPANGILPVPSMFNTMGSLSNYTAIVTLDNGLEVFFLISAFDLQSPLFSLPDGIDFFFQHERNDDFSILSFNFTRNVIPFDLSCNLKSELFAEGTTFTDINVGFLQKLLPVPPTKDVVVACIDPNSPALNPDEPSFGGSNALLTFVSFGDTSGIGAFLNFTDNYGDFFGAPLPFLFVILAAALFTGRSAPTGIIIVGIAIGIMWYMEILTIDPILWGVIITLVILGAIGGKKFL